MERHDASKFFDTLLRASFSQLGDAMIDATPNLHPRQGLATTKQVQEFLQVNRPGFGGGSNF